MRLTDLLIAIAAGLLIGFFLFGGYLIGAGARATGACIDRPCADARP